MNKVKQADLGTPASSETNTIDVEIDGLPATVKAGTSILRAARESGVDEMELGCFQEALANVPLPGGHSKDQEARFQNREPG